MHYAALEHEMLSADALRSKLSMMSHEVRLGSILHTAACPTGLVS